MSKFKAVIAILTIKAIYFGYVAISMIEAFDF